MPGKPFFCVMKDTLFEDGIFRTICRKHKQAHPISDIHFGNSSNTLIYLTCLAWCTINYTERKKLWWTGTVTSPYNSWSRGDRGMKIWSKVALDVTIADTKFQGSGYTGSRVVPIKILIFDQFFKSPEGSKSWNNISTHKSEHFEAKNYTVTPSSFWMCAAIGV